MTRTEAPAQAQALLRYSVFEFSALGSMRLAGEIEAASDAEALRQARQLVPYGTGELRLGFRVICRFGRA